MKIVVTQSIRGCFFLLLESLLLLFVLLSFPSISSAYSVELESMLLSWLSASLFSHRAVGLSVAVLPGVLKTCGVVVVGVC